MTGQADMRVAGLFAGIGGIERGLELSGHSTKLLCEVDQFAQAVLSERFPDVPLCGDIRDLEELPPVDMLAAGFPCQDLSQAGGKRGINGPRSSVVDEIFRLCENGPAPDWLLIENVSYMLRLQQGRAMAWLVSKIENLGYRWAYRVVDVRSFRLPQRRQRVVLLASRCAEPEKVLFADTAPDPSKELDRVGPTSRKIAYGFYWTEGLRGLGWTHDAVPTIKGGSGLGIPSPPAVWDPLTGEVGTPQLPDCERLQGFPQGWTDAPGMSDAAKRARWRLVGNAMPVPLAQWIGDRINAPDEPAVPTSEVGRRWPFAAAGSNGMRVAYDVGLRTQYVRQLGLRRFLQEPLKPLSQRATDGFLSRARRARINFPDGLIEAMELHAGHSVGIDEEVSS